ncbi:MAG: hypothetical protein ACFFD4_37075, partial [Candidatus Odinarchaeota archaeon]
MVAGSIACPHCGSLNHVKSKKCAECGEPLINKPIITSRPTRTDSASTTSRMSYFPSATSVRGTGQPATFHFREHYFLDKNGNTACAIDSWGEFSEPTIIGRRVTLTLTTGKAVLREKSPDKIELLDQNKQVLGYFRIVEKDLFTFECSLGSFKMDRISTVPFKIVDPNGQVALSLEFDPEYEYDTRSRLDFSRKRYTLISSGILDHGLSLIMAMVIIKHCDSHFWHSVKPSTEHAFAVK